MNIKCSQLIHQPIYSLYTNKYIENSDQLVFNLDTNTLSALVLKQGKLFSDHLVKFSLIRDIRPNSIWIDSVHDVKRASKLLQPKSYLVAGAKIFNQPIVSLNGFHLGFLNDIYVNQVGKITSLQIKSGQTNQDLWLVDIKQVFKFDNTSVQLNQAASTKLYRFILKRQHLGKQKDQQEKQKAQLGLNPPIDSSQPEWVQEIIQQTQSAWNQFTNT